MGHVLGAEKGIFLIRGAEADEATGRPRRFNPVGQSLPPAEAIPFLRDMISPARTSLGPDSHVTMKINLFYCLLILKHFRVRASDHGLSKSDAMLEMIEAAEMLEELARRARRVLGASHPFATEVQSALEYVRSLGVLERVPR